MEGYIKMKIAVAAEGTDLDSQVSMEFAKCLYLLVIEMNDLSFKVIPNEKVEDHSDEDQLVEKVLAFNCEAVITGHLEPKAFDRLANACITRYHGLGHTVQEALRLMDQNQLQIIRDSKGFCSGHHHEC